MSSFQFILFYLKKMITLSYLCIRIILPYKRIETDSVASSTSIEATVMLIKVYGSNVDSFFLLILLLALLFSRITKKRKECSDYKKTSGEKISRILCIGIVLPTKLITQYQLYPRKKWTRYTLSYFILCFQTLFLRALRSTCFSLDFLLHLPSLLLLYPRL